jgi:pimeloyl-ACP methyl ester carboxylesterase
LSAAVIIAAVCLCVPLAGWLYQKLGERRDARRLPPPGEILGGFHVVRGGDANIPIVFEAGIASTSLSWMNILKLLPPGQRFAAYDRLGYGWSGPPSSPRTLDAAADELLRLLDLAGITSPAVFAGHSFGGLVVRHIAALHPERVAALLLLDPLEPFEWHPLAPERVPVLARGVMLSRRGALLARLGVVRFALDLLVSGTQALPRLLARASAGKGSNITGRLVGEVRKMPPEIWPAVKAHWCRPLGFTTMAEYLERLPDSCRQASTEPIPPDIPVTIITASTAPAPVRAAHAAYATRHLTPDNTGHWVQLDQPQLVLDELLRLTTL